MVFACLCCCAFAIVFYFYLFSLLFCWWECIQNLFVPLGSLLALSSLNGRHKNSQKLDELSQLKGFFFFDVELDRVVIRHRRRLSLFLSHPTSL
jgi:hypothetical protein